MRGVEPIDKARRKGSMHIQGVEIKLKDALNNQGHQCDMSFFRQN